EEEEEEEEHSCFYEPHWSGNAIMLLGGISSWAGQSVQFNPKAVMFRYLTMVTQMVHMGSGHIENEVSRVNDHRKA
ncbi:hypothetical protein Dimus_029528, partial [Dionaea muscipula]